MLEFFKKIFGGKKQPRETITTAPLSEAQLQAIVSNTAPRYDIQQLLAACGQSVGKQRDLNEDSLLAITATLAGNGGNTPFGLYIVADGMGGHQYGEIASNAAIRVVAGTVMQKFQPFLFNIKPEPPNESLQELMLAGVNEAQKVIQREAPGSGTTLTAALILGQQVTVAHVGDSRAYMLNPDGRVETITRDHSLVKRLEELGHISPSEAENYPHRNVLYRALGQGELLEPDIFTIPFPTAGTLILCSDGLWGVITESDLPRVVREAPTLQRACQNLVAAANLAGGPDNISVVLVQLAG